MISILLIIIVIVVALIIAIVIPKAKQKRRSKTCLYYHHEYPSYFGPHGDTLMVIFVQQTKDKSQQLVYPEKQELEIIEKVQSDLEGFMQ